MKLPKFNRGFHIVSSHGGMWVILCDKCSATIVTDSQGRKQCVLICWGSKKGHEMCVRKP